MMYNFIVNNAFHTIAKGVQLFSIYVNNFFADAKIFELERLKRYTWMNLIFDETGKTSFRGLFGPS